MGWLLAALTNAAQHDPGELVTMGFQQYEVYGVYPPDGVIGDEGWKKVAGHIDAWVGGLPNRVPRRVLMRLLTLVPKSAWAFEPTTQVRLVASVLVDEAIREMTEKGGSIAAYEKGSDSVRQPAVSAAE